MIHHSQPVKQRSLNCEVYWIQIDIIADSGQARGEKKFLLHSNFLLKLGLL